MTHKQTIRIQKRDGNLEYLDISKIVRRIDLLIEGVDDNGNNIGNKLNIDANVIALEICQHVTDKIKSTELDEHTAKTCAYKLIVHPEYNELAKRIVISNNHKNSKQYKSILEMTTLLNKMESLSDEYISIINQHHQILDQTINHQLDYQYIDYFGFKTLEKNYLLRMEDSSNNIIIERLQHMWMRVAIEIHRDDIDRVIKCYHSLSNFYYIHATPTLFNSGHKLNQLSSCFLIGIPDKIDSMYECLRRLALISKNAGGIGVWMSNIRGNNAIINSSGGKGSGIIPYIKTLNCLSKHVDQGGKRKGSIAIYMEPWHPDIMEFLDLRKNNGNEEYRARDVFLALFISDLFMSRLKQATLSSEVVLWSLMCPKTCPGLADCYGEKFEQLYCQYEANQQYVKQVNILDLWTAILVSQMETGVPYMLYKDSINKKSNQENIGVIKSSNLCSEIVQYSSHDEYAVCNLSSISLPKYVNPNKPLGYDLQLLADISSEITRNLNRVIDMGYSPTPQIRKSNTKHRAIGIGVQGLAEAFFELKIAYSSPQAQNLNRLISEAIYYGAVRESIVLARERQIMLAPLKRLSFEIRDTIVKMSGKQHLYQNALSEFQRQSPTILSDIESQWIAETIKTIDDLHSQIKDILDSVAINYSKWSHVEWSELQYWDHTQPNEKWGTYSSYNGSPTSKGLLQFDLWNVQPSDIFDWNKIKQDMAIYGIRNSLLVAYMPTASTSLIMGNTECFEPITSNLFSRSVLSGSFIMVNKYLQRDLLNLGLWNTQLKNEILLNEGSVQNIDCIPQNLKDIYKTSWEIARPHYLNMSADRSAFIDQSQSLNIYFDYPTYDKLTSLHVRAWELGLKTGMYYLRRKKMSNPQQFTIKPSKYVNNDESVTKPKVICTEEICVMCQ